MKEYDDKHTGERIDVYSSDDLYRIRLRAHNSIYSSSIEFLMEDQRERDKWFVIDGFILKEVTDEPIQFGPSFRMRHQHVQTLMDDFWNAGLRPSEGTGSAGQLAATQKHLNDFRAIAGKKLGIEFK